MDITIPTNKKNYISIKEIKDYIKLIDHKCERFNSINTQCLALTQKDIQCYHSIKPNYLLCKLHRKQKYKPDYIIVYIHNHLEKNKEEHHIITYPYKNKENYLKNIELYKNELIETEINNIIKLKEITTCKVCSETFLHIDLIKCSNTTCDNKHLVCSECFEGYINSQILNNIGSYDCMFNPLDICKGEYTTTIIDKIITNPDTNEKFNTIVTINNLFKIANICDDYHICPLCRKWGCIVGVSTNTNENMTTIKCEQCHLYWCNKCKREEHSIYSCYKLNFKEDETEEKQNAIVDKMIQDIITKIITRKCSTCGCVYIKEEGCNLVTCEQCYSMSCYLCNTKLYYKENKGKYWHYIGHDRSDANAVCTIFNNKPEGETTTEGNTIYTKKTIMDELFNFIEENNIPVIKIIIKRIYILYRDDLEFNFIPQMLTDFINNKLIT